MPRKRIPHDGTFKDDVPLALVVEEEEDAPEPCDYLNNSMVICYYSISVHLIYQILWCTEY